MSPVIQASAAIDIGKIRPKAHTGINGLNTAKHPINPNIAPDAPNEAG